MNRLAVILALLAALFSMPAEARTKKGDKFLEEGRAAEASKDYDKALEAYEKALATDPSDAAYMMSTRRVRFQAGQAHVDRGQKLRLEGKLEEALTEFQKAYIIDPASTIAEQEVRRTNQMIDREKNKSKESGAGRPAAADPEDRGLSPAQLARKNAEDRAATIAGVPELKPISRQVTNLKMVNQPPKVLYETLGKLTGTNILFDSEYQDQGKRFSLDLTNTSLEEALDYVALLTKTFWKPLSANAVFITQDTAVKRRDYEEHVTRVFYLQNVTSAQELQEAMTAMRAITDVRKVFPFNSQSAIVVRGTVDQVALAEKILLDLDKPKPEVVVDVYVMEANKTKTRDLAATLMSGGKPGFSTSITYSPIGAGASGGSVRLSQLGNISASDFVLTMPAYFLQAVMSDRQTRLLTQPQVRATDGQKATLRLGDRYPYATGSFQPGVGGVGVSPLVSTQFQFADVGVNVDLTPRIHGADEVSLQITVDITNIKERIDVGGLSQPVIGQRKVEHIIRVREGETTLIGGLMQSLKSTTKSGVPGLMQIPGLGRLFQSENLENSDADLMVALVPHIVRAPDIQLSNLKSIASGTETIWKVNYANREAPQGAAAPAQGGAAVPAAAQPMMNPLGAQPPAAAGTQPVPAGTQPPATPPPPTMVPPSGAFTPPAPTPQTAAPAVSTGAGVPAVLLKPTALRLQKSGTVTVVVQVENMQDLFSAPMRLTYNGAVLKLLEVNKGDFMGSDGQQVVFSETKVPDQGKAIVSINRVPGAGGMSGGGTLVTLKFQALAAGESPIGFEELTLRDAKLQPIKVAAPATTIAVQ